MRQYELICGLSVHLSKDAEIRYEEEDGSLLVRANLAILGDSLFTARGLCLRAKLVGSEVHDLVVHVEKLVVDPLVTRNQLLDFLERFGLPKEENEQHGEARATRMSHEEWKQFLQNAKQDTRHIPDNTTLVSWDDMATVDECGGCHRMDLKIPLARVMATQCELAAYNGAMEFPDCQGSEAATVRTLLEYYARSVLNQMDLWNGDKADVSLKAVASDVASVKYSMIGAGVGAVLLGPAGYVAGCYLGDRFIRNLGSSSLTCGLAGAALFGPVGLVAGAVASTADVDKPVERRQSKSTAVIVQAGKASRKGVVQSATDHVKASKYEYGGTTGVVAGAMVGLAVAGPVGLIAGSVAGSMGGRKLVEKTTTPVAQNDGQQPQAEGQGNKKPYQFGDFTRGVLARGKQARHANSGGGYRFGDFTRGLMSRKQAS
ncbi:expressed unknown protein [Seminavis robusta]|uniref:Uncharacterized protein n=1 Tax=Seminavis robusta TaxID=568900 RepID=A0A9N8DF20_9STRA|nr:expressed unknown protein [Seminavis robusta]|eukprot:Sro126_g060450.1 n/a (431) ;mRNA; f:14662-15954